MRNLRAVLSLAAVLAAACAAPARADTVLNERSERVDEARGVRLVRVENERGRVEVRSSADGRIHVSALKVSRGADEALTRDLAKQVVVQTGASGERYLVHVSYPRHEDVKINLWSMFGRHGSDGPIVPRLEVRLVVDVPAPCGVEVVTASGDVVSHQAGGNVSVNTASGDVQVEDAAKAEVHTASGDVTVDRAGSVRIETASGDVRLAQTREKIWLRSASGSFKLDAAPGGVDAGTMSGTIEVDAAAGRLGLSSASGDITVKAAGALQDSDLSSTSGDVRLEFEHPGDALLELSSTSGSLTCDLPVRLLEHGSGRLSAQYGRGGPRLHLHTTSGDIHVTSTGR